MAMQGTHRDTRDVLLVMDQYDPHLHTGISRFAREQKWHLSSEIIDTGQIPWGWQGDGILAALCSDDALTRFVANSGIPAVQAGSRVINKIPMVMIEEQPLVETAIEHFTSRGFENFACIANEPEESTRVLPSKGFRSRIELFVMTLKQRGFDCQVLDWEDDRSHITDSWPARGEWLTRNLMALPKPLAVLCCNDSMASCVVRACRTADIGIPESVAVLGVGNNPLICDALSTPVSSIDTDAEGRGYCAATLLAAIMNGTTIDPFTCIPPKCLITRKSTDILTIDHPCVTRALRFIWDNSEQPISVKDIAQVAEMSTRGLHKAFVNHLGRSPIKEVQRVRLEKAKRLLRESDRKTATIARETGYESAKNLFRAFRQQLDMTPRQYRQQYRGA